MYQEHKEYLDFLKDNNVTISSELLSTENAEESIFNPDLDWEYIISDYQKNKITVIDDFLSPSVADRLRNFVLYYNKKEDFYNDYAAINFYNDNSNGAWFPLLTNIVNGLLDNFKPNKRLTFLRAWSFIYKNNSHGVTAHADPAYVNFNLWVTPDECFEHVQNANGFDIWKIYPPDNWSWQDYNQDVVKVDNFLRQYENQKISIEYKFNRIVIFDSKFFHKGQQITSKAGYKNRRINYTFLFN